MSIKNNVNVAENLQNWSKFAKVYDPIKCASIDGTDTLPHDRAIERAIKSTYRPNRFVKGRPECTIFVSRLNHETTKDTIKEIFSKYGKLKRFRMVKDIVTGIPKGFAFVEYEEERSAEDAYKMANKMVVDGHMIFVDFECERLLKGWKPRRLGGGFGGKKESGQLRFGGRDRCFRKPIALEIQEEEERKLKEKERRKKEEERYKHERHREKNTRTRKRSTERHSSNSPVRRTRYSPPRKVSRHHSPIKENYRSSPKSNDYARDKSKYQSPVRDSQAKRSSPPRDRLRYVRSPELSIRKTESVEFSREARNKNTSHLESSLDKQEYASRTESEQISYRRNITTSPSVGIQSSYPTEQYGLQTSPSNNMTYRTLPPEVISQQNINNVTYYSLRDYDNRTNVLHNSYSNEYSCQQTYTENSRQIIQPKRSNDRYSPVSDGRKLPEKYHSRYSPPPRPRHTSPRSDIRPGYPIKRRSPYRENYKRYSIRDARKY